MHPCEPFTHDLWICLQCGNLFPRIPHCDGCREDPIIQNHVCQPEEALVEGDCQPDEILVSKEEA